MGRLPRKCHFLLEVVIRVAMVVTFFHLEKATPFKRVIHQDEIWLYRNPITADFVPVRYLWIVVTIVPLLVFTVHLILTRNKKDFVNAVLSFTLALPLNGVITDTVKLIIGRPRPDFFWRCFPNGEMNSEMECTGNPQLVMEGRKSFPSGHSSFSFVAMGFLSTYLMRRLHVFTEKGQGQSWRLLLSLLPLFFALLVALSRTCDYHHHWQDVVVGSLLGWGVAIICYRQYFPGDKYRTPKAAMHLELASESLKAHPNDIGGETGEETKLMIPDIKSSTKWI